MLDSSDTGAQPPRRAPRPLSWLAVLGFGALALLWPLLRILGLESALGDPAAGILTAVIVLAAWILGAGFGDVPRPVATLALSGVVFAVLLLVTSLLLGLWRGAGVAPFVFGVVVEAGLWGGLGALAGLAAAGIQRARRRGGAHPASPPPRR